MLGTDRRRLRAKSDEDSMAWFDTSARSPFMDLLLKPLFYSSSVWTPTRRSTHEENVKWMPTVGHIEMFHSCEYATVAFLGLNLFCSWHYLTAWRHFCLLRNSILSRSCRSSVRSRTHLSACKLCFCLHRKTKFVIFLNFCIFSSAPRLTLCKFALSGKVMIGATELLHLISKAYALRSG